MRRFAPLLKQALILDIDGVLIRGNQNIPGAAESLRTLDAEKIPYVLLTNGWGTEARKAEQVSRIIDYPIDPSRVIVSHTPMRDFDSLKQSRVLISSKRHGLDPLKGYGFTHAVWSADHINSFPLTVPLRHKEYLPCDETEYEHALHAPCDATPYEAVMVLGEPAEWYAELQLITDVLRTDPKTMSLTTTQHVPLYWFNDDLTFAGEHHAPRLAGGALLSCIQAVFKDITGKALKVNSYGKPHLPQYRFAEKLLKEVNRSGEEITEVYCVGDNVLSDVRGANGAGDLFTSVLVLSGIQKERPQAESYPIQQIPDLCYEDLGAFMKELVSQREKAADLKPATIKLITCEHCPLCDEGADLLEDLGMEVLEVPLTELAEEEREKHKMRVPVYVLVKEDGAEVELAHGKVPERALRWKLRKYNR